MGRVSSHEMAFIEFGPGLWYTGEGLCKLYTVAWQLSRVTKLIPESGNLCRATARAAGRTGNRERAGSDAKHAMLPGAGRRARAERFGVWEWAVGGLRVACLRSRIGMRSAGVTK